MQRWTRKAATVATAFVLATGSIGCNDDDATRLASQIFLNLIGADGDTYMTLSVDVDPGAIGTFIDTTSCDLNAAIAGCQLIISGGIPGGSTSTSTTLAAGPITVTVDCTGQAPIPAFQNLADCLTSGNPPNETVVGATATCGAATPLCDTTPDVCVTDSGPNSFCGFGPSTTTSSSSTTSSTDTTSTTGGSTTTTSSTTSTTLNGPVTFDCDIQFATPTADTFGALSWDTDYSAAEGGWDGVGAGVDCNDPLGVADFATFNNCVDPSGCGAIPTDNLAAAYVSIGGFNGPTTLALCGWLGTGATQPVPGDFVITVTDASRPDITPIVGAQVEIEAILCTPVGPTTVTTITSTTTTSTSTSTSTTQTTVTTLSTTTTTGGGGGAITYDVVFAFVEAATIGALQYETDYNGAPGAFDGDGQTAQCTVIVDLGLGFPAFNNQTGTGVLVAAITSVSGFTTTANTDIVTCKFTSPSGTAPVAGDFGITVVDASDPTTNPIAPANVVISSITPE